MLTYAQRHSISITRRLSVPATLRYSNILLRCISTCVHLQLSRSYQSRGGKLPVLKIQSNRSTQARTLADMAAPKLQNLKVSAENGIATLLYSIPKANALSPQTMKDLISGLSWAEENPEVKVVVLSGEGKFFTAGLDLTNVPKEDPVLPDSSIDMLR